ncbi:helix-turn-helix domain-containing protein [Azospirillum doebereinerae]|uniref:Helix-turn-helix domain-containing protein n=1 Tax=Azospirillum doebereinerae TaxID=92933 RepID=A0A433J3J7_9PROT|nr:helix-turn-helix domain-containing protein [Azospirillum doebereinerae]RUQ66418.1 helix-turn-helix domain-containing protein [Azospirillum doebereinerae]
MTDIPNDITTERHAGERQSGERWGRIPAWWLDHPELDADGLAILAALSTYADEVGVCWPSQATLAAKLKRSRPTVNRILGRLEALGLVIIEHRSGSNGGRLSCRYRLRLTPTQGAGPPPDSKTDSPCPAASQKHDQPEQIPDSLRGRKRIEAMAQEVPIDWVPAEADRTWAVGRFPEADLDRHAELFVRRCQAHGYRYRDIGAAWRSWLLQDLTPEKRVAEKQAGDQRPQPPRKPASAVARAAEAEQRISAWASVAAHLNAGSSTASSPWV